MTNDQPYRQLNGPCVVKHIDCGATGKPNAVGVNLPIEVVRHLHSGKPLRRPLRTRLIDRMA